MSRLHFRILLGLVIVGAVLRIGYFEADTSLWGDEAMLAANLAGRSYGELASPLDQDQHAPYGFLIIEKALFDTFGLNERWLRSLPFVSSALALLAFPWVAFLFLTPRARLFATASFALCPSLIRYAGELKPYAGDCLASLIVLAAGQLAMRSQRAWRLMALAVAGAVLVWFSYPVVFVLVGVGSAVMVDRVRTGNYKDRFAAAAMIAAWVCSFLAVYAVTARHSVANKTLETFWAYYFVPFPPRSLWDLRHSADLLMSLFANPLGVSVGLGAMLVALGLIRASCRLELLTFCITPIVLAFAASTLHLYPFSGRLLLFAVPLALVPMAEGAASISAGSSRLVPAIVAVTMILPQGAEVKDLLDHRELSGVRDVLPVLSKEAQPGDTVYVYYGAVPSFRVYENRLSRPDLTIRIGSADVREGSRVQEDLAGLSGHRRVWFLFSQVHTFFVDEEALMRTQIALKGKLAMTLTAEPAQVYLYESGTGEWTAR